MQPELLVLLVLVLVRLTLPEPGRLVWPALPVLRELQILPVRVPPVLPGHWVRCPLSRQRLAPPKA